MEKEFDQRDVFLTGRTIYLRALTERDVFESNWYGWFNDEEVTKFMQKHHYPNSKKLQLAYFYENIRGSKTKLQLGIVKQSDPEKLIGCVSLNSIDFINRKADISTIIGEKEDRNVASFLEANSLIIQHAFSALNIQRIYGGTVIKEVADIMCRVLGFKHEGILRQDVFKDDRYHDVYFIGLLKDEFKKAH